MKGKQRFIGKQNILCCKLKGLIIWSLFPKFMIPVKLPLENLDLFNYVVTGDVCIPDKIPLNVKINGL